MLGFIFSKNLILNKTINQMKKIKLLLFLLLMGGAQVYSQVDKAAASVEENLTKSSFFLETGANVPAFGWGSDYGYAKTGFEVGLGWDYYIWKKWGLGIDIRYHQNGLNRKDNTIDLEGSFFDPSTYTATYNEKSSGNWKGTSIAIGPTYRTPVINDKWLFESYVKSGVARYSLPSLNAGYIVSDAGGNTAANTLLIDGYRHKNVEKVPFTPFAMVGVRMGYETKSNWSFYGSVNYKTTFINRDNYYYDYDRSLAFQGIEPLAEGIGEEVNIDGKSVNASSGYFGVEKERVTDFGSIQSFGILVGVKYTPSLVKTPKEKKKKEKKTSASVINVKVKDKPSGGIIPNADVALIDSKGVVVSTAKSDAFGMVKFEGVKPGNYTTKAMVYGKSTTIESISKAEFASPVISKEVLYEDLEFILIGTAKNIDTKKPISEVLVSLEDKTNKGIKQATTPANGGFDFRLAQESDYQVYGSKGNLFTNTSYASTKGLKRSQTLFVELELGMQDPCGKNITLNNIYYDLDKYFIREEAKPDLDRVVEFMKNNPDVMIELSSHTDCRASDSYNQTLSQNRANAAVDYIVSQGASRAKITGVGYGESRLLNRCADGVTCSEEEHQVNRRTEVKVICP